MNVEAVIELELAMATGEARHSAAELDRLLDADFLEIGASGRLWTRGEIIGALVREAPGEQRGIAVSQLTGMTIGPDLVLLRYVTDGDGRRARRSSLWRRTSGSWRLLHHQGTLSGG